MKNMHLQSFQSQLHPRRSPTALIFLLLLLFCSSLSTTICHAATITTRALSKLQGFHQHHCDDFRNDRKGRRRLGVGGGALERYAKSANIFLQWETDQLMTETNSVSLADEAQRFITRNIPNDLEHSYQGIVSIGIFSVEVIKQTLIKDSLWVQLQVNGTVTADSSFHSNSFPFTRIVDTAIRIRGNEFQRLVENLVAVGGDDDDDDDDDDNNNIIIVVSLSAALVVVISGVAMMVYRKKWKAGKEANIPKEGNHQQQQVGVGGTNSSTGERRAAGDESSMAENSVYTLRGSEPVFSRTATNNSSSSVMILPPSEDENGGKIFNPFVGWSFSMSSDGDGGSLEFDVNSADDNPPKSFRSRYTIENVDDISIGKDVDVFEDIKDEEEAGKDAAGTFVGATFAGVGKIGISPLEPPASTNLNTDLTEGVDLDQSGRSTKSRLSVHSLEEFDQYLEHLWLEKIPAPSATSLARTKSTKLAERFMV